MEKDYGHYRGQTQEYLNGKEAEYVEEFNNEGLMVPTEVRFNKEKKDEL